MLWIVVDLPIRDEDPLVYEFTYQVLDRLDSVLFNGLEQLVPFYLREALRVLSEDPNV